MRSAVSVALLVATASLLAGCSGNGGGDDIHVTCPDGKELHSEDYANVTTTPDLLKKCSGTGGTRTNTTTQAPNQLPVLVLKTTDSGGNATNVTTLNGNVTFDATGSSDPDGTITGIAVTVQDSNTTRTASLYDAGKKQFKTATFKFDRSGPVNVTVAMVDDRAGFAVTQTKVFVNHPQDLGSHTFAVGDPSKSFDTEGHCTGFAEENTPDQTASDALVYMEFSVAVGPGATFIEVTRNSGTAQMTICDPNDVAVSDSSDEDTVVSNKPLPPATGIKGYRVSVYSTAAGAQNEVALSAVVHYEPQAAAPAA